MSDVLSEILPKGPRCWDKGSVDTEREMFIKNVPFHNGRIIKRGNWANGEVLINWISMETSSGAALLAHTKRQQPACVRPPLQAHLISSTFSATSTHIDERKRSHHQSRYVACKNKSRPAPLWQRRKRNKSCEIRAQGFFFFSTSQRWDRTIK